MRDQETTKDAWAASQSSPYRIGSPEREGCVCTHDMRRGPRDIQYTSGLSYLVRLICSATEYNTSLPE